MNLQEVFELELLEDGEEKDSQLCADEQHLVSLPFTHPSPLAVEMLWFQAVVNQWFSCCCDPDFKSLGDE